MSIQTSPPPPAMRAGTLSRGRILDGAIALVEGDGPNALSMRRLGSSLGVEAMAIYHYFSSREELLGALSDRLLESLDELEFDHDWRDSCARVAVALREVIRTHPSTFQLLASRPLDAPWSLRVVERLMELLLSAGFTPARGLAVYRATITYARGYALAEAAGFTVDAARPVGRKRLAELPAAEYPILHGRSEELASLEAEQAFRLGLAALLRGWGDPAGSPRGETTLTSSKEEVR